MVLIVFDLGSFAREKRAEDFVDEVDNFVLATEIGGKIKQVILFFGRRCSRKDCCLICSLLKQVRISVAKTVDTLLDISDHEDVVSRYGGDDPVLDTAGVLILVNVDLVEAVLHLMANICLL